MFEEERSKYPIADMGDDFQPDAMEDFDARVQSGEFKDLSITQIRVIYREEEMRAVEQREDDEMNQNINDMEESEFQRSLGE